MPRMRATRSCILHSLLARKERVGERIGTLDDCATNAQIMFLDPQNASHFVVKCDRNVMQPRDESVEIIQQVLGLVLQQYAVAT
jgi:hypothetical protein